VSKIVAGVYAVGIVAASSLMFGAAASIVSGYYPASIFDGRWITLLAFSGLPIAVLLVAAMRREWKQKGVSGQAFFFVATAVLILILIGVFAHAENADLILSLAEIAICSCGAYALRQKPA
jgi:hypothetical protein